MPYVPKGEWRVERICKRVGCGKSYLPNQKNQLYCSHRCKSKVSGAHFKLENPEYWLKWDAKKKESTKRRPPELKPPYNHERCLRCGRPLGRTFNRFYHKECHARVSYTWGETAITYGAPSAQTGYHKRML